MDLDDPTPGHVGQAFGSLGVQSQHHNDQDDMQLSTHQGFLSYSNQLPQPYGLQNFYQSSGPWNPLAGSNLQQSGFVDSLTETFSPPDALIYRGKEQASECDTSMPGADSGYASRPIPSVGHPSRVAIDFPEGERLVNLHLESQSQVAQQSGNLAVPKTPARPRPVTATIPCPKEGCTALIKTKSELTKHIHRHELPFVCEIPDCSRGKKGFSTKNDLQRHLRTVHKRLGGDAQTYYCIIGECAKKGTAKPWPRADNFRQHLQRVHNIEKKAEEDLTSFLGIPNRRPRMEATHERNSFADPNGVALTGVGSFESLHSLKHPQEFSVTEGAERSQGKRSYEPRNSSIEAPQWPAQERYALNAVTDDAREVNGALGPMYDEQPLGSHWTLQQPELGEALCRSPRGSQVTPDGTQEISAMADGTDIPTTPSSICLDSSTPVDVKPEVQQIVDALPPLLGSSREGSSDAHLIIERLRQLIPAETLLTIAHLVVDSDIPSATTESNDSKQTFSCEECQKRFPRQCELKKHKKRHEKPYSCTFKDCNKDFGSKNDWKRHESSQHLQLETWSCDYPGCSKICNRRETFRTHLIREHGHTPDALLEQQLEKRRLGRHCDRRYWCGFCERIQTITENNVNCWTKRCDHIDDHICGRNGLTQAPMASWVYLEDLSRPGTPSRGGRPITVPDVSQPEGRADHSNRNLKRKSDGTDMHRVKRPFQPQPQPQDGWQCCSCTDPLNSTHVNMSCTSCDHRRCSNCESFGFAKAVTKTRGRKQLHDVST